MPPSSEAVIHAERDYFFASWRLERACILAELSELDERGMSEEVRRHATLAGFDLEELHRSSLEHYPRTTG